MLAIRAPGPSLTQPITIRPLSFSHGVEAAGSAGLEGPRSSRTVPAWPDSQGVRPVVIAVILTLLRLPNPLVVSLVITEFTP